MALLIAAFLFIRIYTGHGDPNVRTPNVEGEKVEDAIRILEEGGFDYEITDTVYRDHQPLLTIIDQNPEPDFEVKKGRKIYLVINSDAIPEVEMPDLAGKTSFNIAVRILNNRGLQLGKKITRPHASIMDPDSEPVLDQRFSGDTTSIAPGTRIKKHSKIDLVVGTMMKTAVEDPEFSEGATEGVEIEE
jgi:beta-lactam-binding protein with PASTA domain